MKRSLAALMLLIAAGASAETLSLEAYLAQVRAGNGAFRANAGTESSLKIALLEPKTLLSPYLSGGATYYDDQAEPAMAFSPRRTTATQWEASVGQQISWTGTRLSVGYKGGNQALEIPFMSPDPIYFRQQGLNLTLMQPLLKDFGARGFRLLSRKVEAQVGSGRAWNRYAAAATLFEAEATYLQLGAQQAILGILEDSLGRSQQLLAWSKSKYADNLADKADVLASEAALKQVELGLLQTRQELRQSQQKFNTLRGISVTAALPDLEGVQAPQALPERAGERLDVVAARFDAASKHVIADETEERYMPELNVFGVLAGTGGDKPQPGETWPPDHPTYTVGLKLTTILDIPLYLKVVRGAHLAIEVGNDELAQKRLKEAQDWDALRVQWTATQESLALASALEGIQKEKAEREKKRYQDGRTSNFQVILSEQEYNQARINTLRLRTQAAVLKAQADLYNGGNLSW